MSKSGRYEKGREHSSLFEAANLGKNGSVVLDLKTPSGKESLCDLLADADVFITNVRTDGLRRLLTLVHTMCLRLLIMEDNLVWLTRILNNASHISSSRNARRMVVKDLTISFPDTISVPSGLQQDSRL